MHLLHIEWHAYSAYFACHFAYLMHIILHIILHILHIIIDAYSAYCAYCAYRTLHNVHNVHILDEKVILRDRVRVFIFYATISWSPNSGPSCSRTTNYNYHHCLLIYCRKLRESQPLLDAWRRVLSLSHPPKQEEGVPVWRTLESHTKLVLVHGVHR